MRSADVRTLDVDRLLKDPPALFGCIGAALAAFALSYFALSPTGYWVVPSAMALAVSLAVIAFRARPIRRLPVGPRFSTGHLLAEVGIDSFVAFALLGAASFPVRAFIEPSMAGALPYLFALAGVLLPSASLLFHGAYWALAGILMWQRVGRLTDSNRNSEARLILQVLITHCPEDSYSVMRYTELGGSEN